MGWFSNTLKGFVDPKAAGEGIIGSMERVFRQGQQKYPDLDPHWHLGMAWLSRMGTHGMKQNQDTATQSLTKTYHFACLPCPENIRALGISIILFERPDIMEKCPEFEIEFDQILEPVAKAENEGTLKQLYAKFNARIVYENQQAPRE